MQELSAEAAAAAAEEAAAAWQDTVSGRWAALLAELIHFQPSMTAISRCECNLRLTNCLKR